LFRKHHVKFFQRCCCCSDFPFVVPECGYKGAKEAVQLIANQIPLPSSDLEWIMGKTAAQLFESQLTAAKQDSD
jgi:hypothetical protein